MKGRLLTTPEIENPIGNDEVDIGMTTIVLQLPIPIEPLIVDGAVVGLMRSALQQLGETADGKTVLNTRGDIRSRCRRKT